MKLGEYLEKHNIKQAAFARKVGVSRGRISQLVNGNGGSLSLELALLIEKKTDGAVAPQDWQAEQHGKSKGVIND